MSEPADHPPIVRFARALRKRSTDAERRLWSILRDRGLRGHKFRRQHPVEPYVLDFFCEGIQIAVELDGGQHHTDEGLAHDQARSAFLGKQGIRVIRITNFEMLVNTEATLDWLWREVMKVEPGA
jgi:very-short-patch-repair endonuclease